MEPDLYPCQLVSEHFLTFRPDHDGAQRAVNARARNGDRMPIGDLVANAHELVFVACAFVRQVIIAALMLDRYQQKTAIFSRAAVMIKMLGQLKGVARVHGAAVTVAGECLALYFNGFQALTHQAFTVFEGAMTVVIEHVIHFIRVDVALLIEARHADRQLITGLLVVECLNGHAPRLQASMAAPFGNRVRCLGNGCAVITNAWLLRQGREVTRVIKNDQRVLFLIVIEIEEQAFVFQQPQYKGQIAFTVLGDVTVRLEWLAELKLEVGQCAVGRKYRSDNGFDGLFLKYARVDASREHP
ncbi:hypothetical protein ALP95_05373 [Pseudomonas savastanoi pv. glycinea]|nr:hypothetical protein ALP95_05373 [Pseudomonas savastanoi pv. glycinea]